MADDLTVYRQTLHYIYELPKPDELVQGVATMDLVELTAAGDHKRGLILMSGEDGFIPATSAGLGSAKEVCILGKNITLPEGSKAECAAYFTGTFMGNSLVLGWETEEDDHASLVESIREDLRVRKIFVK